MRIPLAEIIVSERMRAADPAKVAELAESIKTIGLLNPLTINSDNTLNAWLLKWN